jgi:SAM-dependent methyltransferase
MAAERSRARVFGEVADEYDRIRPGYPAALVDDVLAYARLDGAPALEVGAGTGKATLAFVERGVAVTAVEPDTQMAEVLARRGGSAVTIAIATFEDYVPDRPFGLLYSAQAWHWTDPATRWQRAVAALAPGGAIALFWNADRPADPAVIDGIRAAHRAYAPDTEPSIMSEDFGTTEYTELAERTELGDRVERMYESERRVSADDYLANLSTHSAYRILDEAARTRVFDAIREVLGREVVIEVRTALAMARRAS